MGHHNNFFLILKDQKVLRYEFCQRLIKISRGQIKKLVKRKDFFEIHWILLKIIFYLTFFSLIFLFTLNLSNIWCILI